QEGPEMKTVAHEHEALRGAPCLVLARWRGMNSVGGHRVSPGGFTYRCHIVAKTGSSVIAKSGNIAAASTTGSSAERTLRGGHFILRARVDCDSGPQCARQPFEA